jgi:hypothetical protein
LKFDKDLILNKEYKENLDSGGVEFRCDFGGVNKGQSNVEVSFSIPQNGT